MYMIYSIFYLYPIICILYVNIDPIQMNLEIHL